MEWAILLWIFGIGQVYLSYTYLFKGKVSENGKASSQIPLLCYFSLDPNWPGGESLHPAMNATLCTHMIFISSTSNNCMLAPAHPDDPQKYYSKVPVLKKQNPDRYVMLSNGGGGNTGFSQVLASQANRTKFVKSVIPFLKKYDFDGFDIDWEFPGWNGLPIQHRENYSMMLQEMRQEFDMEQKTGGKKYLLSAAVAAGRAVMEIYRDYTGAMAEALDFINLMCYDYHGYSYYDPMTDYNSPLYPNDWWEKIVIRTGNIGWSTNEWHKRGMPKSKIMVGLPTYTHTWTLLMPDKYHGHYAPAKGPGRGCNECSYAWICHFLKNATYVFDEDAAVPYAYSGDQWVSYDNVKSTKLKADWILQNGYGGIMVYNMNSDDYAGTGCGQGKFPLINTLREAIRNHTAVRR